MKKLLVIILILSGIGTHAQETIVTDRPDRTESAITIPLGAFQIEFGLMHEWMGSYNDKSSFNTLPTTLLRYGLSENFELRFQADYFLFDGYSRTVSGFGDFSFGLKAHVYNDENTDMAFIAMATIPSGSENFKNDDITATALFSVSHDFSEVVAIGYNVGLNLNPEQDLSFIYSAAAGFALTDQLSTFVEIFGNWYNFRSTAVSFDLGLTYLLNDNLQLDVSYGRGINYQTNFLSLGVSWRIMPN